MAKIFISYHRASKDVVEELVRDLTADDHDVWFDQNLTGGHKWWNDILTAIRECDIFIAALTLESLESRPCKYETKYAIDLQRQLLPVRLSDKVSPDSLPPNLGELQWVDYSRRDISAFQILGRTLRRLLPAPQLPDPLPKPPAIPLSYLNQLKDRIETDSDLQFQMQAVLVLELRQQFRNGESPKAIVDLLQRLKKRNDLFAAVMQDIDDLMRDIARGLPGNRSLPSEPEQPDPDEHYVPRQPRVGGAAREADVLVADVLEADGSKGSSKTPPGPASAVADPNLRTVVSSPNLKGIDVSVGLDKLATPQSEDLQPEAEIVQKRTLDEATRGLRESYANEVEKLQALPGGNAPRFSAWSSTVMEDLLVRPSAYPMTPMYLLDNAFRIIDWNEAFSVAFDRTMEGRKGQSVLEWTYFLDNYTEVLDHGAETFRNSNALPPIDVEKVRYTSQRYGELTATKRAYQIPDDDKACLAWLVTLDVKFSDKNQHAAFQRDLIRVLGLDLTWTEYAVAYDRVLSESRVYSELLDKFIGGYDGVRAMPENAKILDLGAGTGNFARKLITAGPDRVIFAIDNNRHMLELLKAKCQKFLRTDPYAGGVIPIKQDITSLFGLDDEDFDFVTLSNVLYAVQDADSCLAECCRVLKPGGELRFSGPRQDTNLKVLFERIEKDLREDGRFDELQADYDQVYQINELKLRPMLNRWTTNDVEKMLINAGFSAIVHSSEDAYAGQSMFICAVK